MDHEVKIHRAWVSGLTAIFIMLFCSITYGCTESAKHESDNMKACVAAGGSWMVKQITNNNGVIYECIKHGND